MKKTHLLRTLLAVSVTAAPLAAQQPLSLKQCIEYGLKNHGSLRISGIRENIAKEQARDALSAYLPQVNASGSLDDNLKLQTTVLPGSLIGTDQDLKVKMGTKYSTVASAQADQVVYDQSLLIGLKANKPNIRNAELNARKTREDLVYSIANQYYQVFILKQQIALLQDNQEKTEKMMGILKLQLDNGVVKKVDHDRVQVSLNNIRSQLTLAESNFNLALNQLKLNMGMPLSESLALDPADTEKPVAADAQTSTFDPVRLTDYNMQRTNMQLLHIEKDRIRAGYLPKLSVYGRYGLQALGSDLGTSWNNWFGFGTVGVKLSIPIFDSFKRDAQWKQAHLNLMTNEEQLKLNLQRYELQHDNSKIQLQRARINLASDEENIRLAKEVYEVTSLQFSEGTITLSDLLNAEMSYKEAQSNYINSMLSYYQAYLGLEQSQGTLLTFYEELN